MAPALAPLGRFALGVSWSGRATARPALRPRRAAAEAGDPEATRAVLSEMMHRDTDRAQAEFELLMLRTDSLREA